MGRLQELGGRKGSGFSNWGGTKGAAAGCRNWGPGGQKVPFRFSTSIFPDFLLLMQYVTEPQ